MLTKEDHTCDICKKMFPNIKLHLFQKHRHVGTMIRPTKKDSIETYKKYYNT